MPQRKSKSKRVRSAARRSNTSRNTRSARAPTKTVGPSVAFSLKETLPVFPVSKTVTQQLYYESGLTMTGAAGILTRYVFSANGAYDPNITGTGHQMMGFDQMMLFYEQYVVVRSKIKVTFWSATATPQRVAISLCPDTTVAASITDLVENGLTVMSYCGNANTNGMFRGDSVLELTCDVAKYFGRSRKDLIAGTEFYGTAAANPVEQVYYQIQTWNPATATTVTCAFDVVLSFDIFYYEPRKTGGSFWHTALDALRLHRELTLKPTDGGGLAKTCGPNAETKCSAF